MILHGIVLAHPDKYYRAQINSEFEFMGYAPVDGEPCLLPEYAAWDPFVAFVLTGALADGVTTCRFIRLARQGKKPWRVYSGITGMVLGYGDGKRGAITDARHRLSNPQMHAKMLRSSIEWLKVNSLSPRWAWAGGTATFEPM